MAAGEEIETYKYSKSCFESRVLISTLLSDGSGKEHIGKEVVVGGWVRSGRLAEKDTLVFVHLNDGTTSHQLQAVIRSDISPDFKKCSHTGACVVLKGKIVSSQKENQDIELAVSEIKYVSDCDPKTYPMSKKGHGMVFLREKPHLRSRTNLMSCVFRVRNTLAAATHSFFQSKGFIYCHSPIITSSDCEGAGEMLQVSHLMPKPGEKIEPVSGATPENLAAIKADLGKAKGELKALKEEGAEGEKIKEKEAEVKAIVAKLKETEAGGIFYGGIPVTKEGEVNYSKDFFRGPSYLTVSGQLQAEALACSMSNTYTFGPTFRAEDSNTVRHLSEFWMIEPEIAFADLFDDMDLAEDYVKFCCKSVYDNNLSDLEAFAAIRKFQDEQERKAAEKAAKSAPKGKKGQKKGQQQQKEEKQLPAWKGKRAAEEGCVERVKNVIENSFERLSYTKAIEILIEKAEEAQFDNSVSWGIDLASEHERYLAEVVYKKPVIIYNYPKDIKAFYMRQNDDGKTVAAMDIVCPQIGELIGGSQREERFDVLEDRCKQLGMDTKEMDWYFDLRKYGTVPHSGFGLGFERLVMFVTGMENIRDVIPFPRPPMSAIV